MSTILENDLLDLISLNSENDKVEFEKEVLHAMCMNQVRLHMGKMKNAELAKKIGVSSSFISQLFSGDKIVSLELLAKFQRVLKFKFYVESKSDIEKVDEDTNVIKMPDYRVTYNTTFISSSFRTTLREINSVN
jgi:transcriptional regulator with XRE-family HTH domain